MRLDHLLSKENRSSKKNKIPKVSSRAPHCSILRILKQVSINGGIAQLGEHLLCKQGVRSSILLISTIGRNGRDTAEELT